ncbi:DUF5642 family protein [Mycolicibacterium wolinskyi]|uniref:DUF5642 domain-containing protein n=1 Tax=Mycolicibacterium wolinskyi TaxID=59750 RepID=A0A1X2FDN4_9MYCO|nr:MULTISPECIES: DUF5642 family protein [Mycolicibacterium]MCV7284450.1 DUF5642 family protein [Mycolicibacterium wolinskyi]MCV7291839.1 DUF5642 family protein [Mycolicibacterium goodii]ORX16546.1 hypothetical protein AWC31_21175 [Mycolicibacterium wolinskyi]
MRLIAAGVAVALCTAACGQPPAPAPTSTPVTTTAPDGPVNPARIDRVRQELPDGYEVTGIDTRTSPIALWGFGPDWQAEPEPCATLAAAAVDPATARGWSASGSGGIVYAVVARTTAPPDPALADRCGQWTLSGGHATAIVTGLAAPAIDGAQTAGMAAAIDTVVEGGTETRSHADTFTADLGAYHCFVTVVTDPGSPNAALGADFAADLLVKTVSALRG